MTNMAVLQKRIQYLILFFMCALILSGLTAIPLQWELKIFVPLTEEASQSGIIFPEMAEWVKKSMRVFKTVIVNIHFLSMEQTGWHSVM